MGSSKWATALFNEGEHRASWDFISARGMPKDHVLCKVCVLLLLTVAFNKVCSPWHPHGDRLFPFFFISWFVGPIFLAGNQSDFWIEKQVVQCWLDLTNLYHIPTPCWFYWGWSHKKWFLRNVGGQTLLTGWRRYKCDTDSNDQVRTQKKINLQNSQYEPPTATILHY